MLRRRANEVTNDKATNVRTPGNSPGRRGSKERPVPLLRIYGCLDAVSMRLLLLSIITIVLVCFNLYPRKTTTTDDVSLSQKQVQPTPQSSVVVQAHLHAVQPSSTALKPLNTLFEVIFPWRPESSRSHMLLTGLSTTDDEVNEADYGTVELFFLNATKFRRRIRKKDHKALQHERKVLVKAMDQGYVSDVYLPDDELIYPLECERVAWKSTPKPICNTIHEIVRNFEVDTYLGHGYYRDAWLMPNPRVSHTSEDKTYVLKQMRLPYNRHDEDHIPNAKSFSKIQREAAIMEQLTSSPRIVTAYGHCALTVLSENVPHEVSHLIVPNSGHGNQSILDGLPTARSMNNFTTMQVLNMTLEMCMAIADMHGYAGVMVHGDIHPVQWLRSADGSLKLNDFNNAEILDWSRAKRDYCKTDRGTWGGMYRSPEEFLGEPIDEKIDVYSMGNNIYTLLTGLWPFYEYSKYDDIQAKILEEERPYIDDRIRNRGFVEHSLVGIMERMWEHKPRDRPSIFEVINFLTHVQNAVKRNTSHTIREPHQRTVGT